MQEIVSPELLTDAYASRPSKTADHREHNTDHRNARKTCEGIHQNDRKSSPQISRQTHARRDHPRWRTITNAGLIRSPIWRTNTYHRGPNTRKKRGKSSEWPEIVSPDLQTDACASRPSKTADHHERRFDTEPHLANKHRSSRTKYKKKAREIIRMTGNRLPWSPDWRMRVATIQDGGPSRTQIWYGAPSREQTPIIEDQIQEKSAGNHQNDRKSSPLSLQTDACASRPSKTADHHERRFDTEPHLANKHRSSRTKYKKKRGKSSEWTEIVSPKLLTDACATRPSKMADVRKHGYDKKKKAPSRDLTPKITAHSPKIDEKAGNPPPLTTTSGPVAMVAMTHADDVTSGSPLLLVYKTLPWRRISWRYREHIHDVRCRPTTRPTTK